MKLLTLSILALFITACSSTTPSNKPYFSPQEQQKHSQESLKNVKSVIILYKL